MLRIYSQKFLNAPQMKHIKYQINFLIRMRFRNCPGDAVVKNPPANAGDTGSITGLGRFHMPQSN